LLPYSERKLTFADAISNCLLPSLKHPREHCIPMGILETAGPKQAIGEVVIRRKVSSLGPDVEHQATEEDSLVTENEDHDGSNIDSLFDGPNGNEPLFNDSNSNSLFLYGSADLESNSSNSTLAPTQYTYNKLTCTHPISILISKVKKVKKVKKSYVAAVPLEAHTSYTFLGFACHHQSHVDTTTRPFPWYKTTPCSFFLHFNFHTPFCILSALNTKLLCIQGIFATWRFGIGCQANSLERQIRLH
jgi:hypothetical protein